MSDGAENTDILRLERLDGHGGFDNPTHHIMRSAKGMKIGQVDINTAGMAGRSWTRR